jgi:hypothetical protein
VSTPAEPGEPGRRGASAAISFRPKPFDHALLISRDEDETDRLEEALRSWSLGELAISHDARAQCCHQEAVRVTVTKLMAKALLTG